MQLSNVLEMDTFDCTEAGVKSLKAYMEIYQNLLYSSPRVRRIFSLNNPNFRCPLAYKQWIREHIPCEGDGSIARNHLTDPTVGLPAPYLRRGTTDVSGLSCTM